MADTAKGAFVREMFASIAPRYDVANRVLTAGLDERWRRRAIARARAQAAGAHGSSTSAAAPATSSSRLLRVEPTSR